jgi:hypothetical protein
MSDKSPFIFQVLQQTASIAFSVAIAAIAGMVGYLNSLSHSQRRFNWRQLLTSFFAGGLNGYLMFLLCDAAEWSWQVTAFMTGAAGAMGSDMTAALIRYGFHSMGFFKGDHHGNSQRETEER